MTTMRSMSARPTSTRTTWPTCGAVAVGTARTGDEYRTVKHQSIGHLPGYSDAGYFVDDQKEELSDGEA